jgi:Fe-S-cluster containining protein
VPKNEFSTTSSIIVEEEKNMSEDEKTVSFTCQRCGRCCKEEWWLWEGAASIQDIAQWIATRRYDILDWVDPVVDPCTHEIVFDIWISRKTHDDVNRCPWLRKKRGADLYGCLIHDVKPIACREWPSTIADAQKVGCPACPDISPGKIGQVIEFSKKRPDES